MKTLLGIALAIFIVCLALSSCAYARPPHVHFAGYDAGEVVPHPSGCPWSQFCGCGAAEHIFGHFVPQSSGLWLASSWRKYPRAACAPGNAAVWSGHVAAIESCFGDGTAMLYDANSGGHLTRVHRASLAGAAIVDPHSGREWATAR